MKVTKLTKQTMPVYNSIWTSACVLYVRQARDSRFLLGAIVAVLGSVDEKAIFDPGRTDPAA